MRRWNQQGAVAGLLIRLKSLEYSDCFEDLDSLGMCGVVCPILHHEKLGNSSSPLLARFVTSTTEKYRRVVMTSLFKDNFAEPTADHSAFMLFIVLGLV